MAPARNKKTKVSPTVTNTTRSTTVTTTESSTRTPIASPSKRAANMRITASQKQALIDNLQLEVTERARKLRAQYALQAQSLRTRIEMRVNRIPTSLRKVNMGELLERYLQTEAAASAKTTQESRAVNAAVSQQGSHNPTSQSIKSQTTAAATIIPQPASSSRGTKRTSDVFVSAEDKENTTADPTYTTSLPSKKQRTKHQPATTSTTVLSPKSGNSRTVPTSPSRRTDLISPQKPHQQYSLQQHSTSPLRLVAPKSPSKPMQTTSASSKTTITSTAAATSLLSSLVRQPNSEGASTSSSMSSSSTTNPSGPKTTNSKSKSKSTASSVKAASSSTRGKITPGTYNDAAAAAAAPRTVSSASTTSTGTTIVKQPAAKSKARPTKAKAQTTTTATGAVLKGTLSKAAGKKVAAAAAAAASASAAEDAGSGTGTGKGTRRVLRKR